MGLVKEDHRVGGTVRVERGGEAVQSEGVS